MSRRPPNPAADRAAQNQATLKNLLKIEANKVCADCKRNKHPRWASWNLGIFICIRCSGIHRGMGTHISRVKSVDLDSWTDEQMQSILSWGNARANKYWEAKLAPGHAPSETKVDNFIRTKYELKRWAMDGERPDPATLDVDGDDDVPLSLVKEKHAVQRSESVRQAPAQQQQQASPLVASPQEDLIGGGEPVPRASTTGPSQAKVAPKAEAAAPKPTTTKDSLLGLDFFGEPAAPPRPASTTGVSTPGGQSRPDLKQSILSLYASAPKPQPQQQHQQQQHMGQASMQQMGQFGGMSSPPPQQQQAPGYSGGLNDAFSSLSFGSAAPKPAPSDPFAGFGKPATSRSPPPPASNSAFGGLSGGSFFDPKPSQPAPQPHQRQSSGNAFGDFGSFSSAPSTTTAQKPTPASSSAMGDLFDLSSPVTTTSPPPANPARPAPDSVFNLSSQTKAAAPSPAPASAAVPVVSGMSGADVWGADAWSTPDTGASPPPPAKANPAPAPSTTSEFGWGGASGGFANTSIVPGPGGGFAPAPKVAADEEFGGWASSTGQGSSTTKPAAGFGGDDELFSNVWQ